MQSPAPGQWESQRNRFEFIRIGCISRKGQLSETGTSRVLAFWTRGQLTNGPGPEELPSPHLTYIKSIEIPHPVSSQHLSITYLSFALWD